MKMMVARRMKDTQLVMTLNIILRTLQSSPHIFLSSIMFDDNFCATLIIPLIIDSEGKQMAIIIIIIIFIIITPYCQVHPKVQTISASKSE